MVKKDCSTCNAACCRYVAMEIDCPEDLDDFENIKWYVAHEKVRVYVEEDGTWNVEFQTPCKYLRDDNKCSIHEAFVSDAPVDRPKICKEFGVDTCPHHNEYHEKYSFESIESVLDYIENVFNKGLHEIVGYEDSEEEEE